MRYLILAAVLGACTGTPTPPEPAGPLSVQTASFPVDWLVERIGSDRVDRTCIHPAGEDPPDWQPPAEVIASIARADLLFVNGAGFEAWTATATLPTERVIDTSKGLELIEIEAKTHSHGKSGEHSHAGIDPHTWSDPSRFALQGARVAEALSSADPTNASFYASQLAALDSDLKALSETLNASCAPLRETPLAASHPAFNYLAQHCGLRITSFDFDPETPPADRTEFAQWAADKAPPVLLWEAEPSATVTSAFPENVLHVTLDPLENPTESGYDYLTQARANADRLTKLAKQLAPPADSD